MSIKNRNLGYHKPGCECSLRRWTPKHVMNLIWMCLVSDIDIFKKNDIVRVTCCALLKGYKNPSNVAIGEMLKIHHECTNKIQKTNRLNRSAHAYLLRDMVLEFFKNVESESFFDMLLKNLSGHKDNVIIFNKIVKSKEKISSNRVMPFLSFECSDLEIYLKTLKNTYYPPTVIS